MKKAEKNKKYKFLHALAFGMSLSIGLAGGSIVSNAGEPGLMERGLELIEEMDEMAEETDYVKLLSMAEDIVKVAEQIGDSSYETPANVFSVNLSPLEMKVSDEKTGTMVDLREKFQGFSERLQKDAWKRVIKAAPMNAAGRTSAANLAAVSVLGTSGVFLDQTVEDPIAFYYIYGNEYSAIVTFFPETDGIVTANAYFVVDENLGAVRSEDDLEEWIETYEGITGVTAECVTGD